MADATMEQLQQKTATILKMMAKVQGETDPDKITLMAKEIEVEAKALEALGAAYVKAQVAGSNVQATTTVVLTPEQRKRVHAATGIMLDQFQLPDDAGAQSKAMPNALPQLIEFLAMEEAKRRKIAAESEALTRAELERTLAALEAQGNAQLNEQLEELKRDPKFVGGVLNKKK